MIKRLSVIVLTVIAVLTFVTAAVAQNVPLNAAFRNVVGDAVQSDGDAYNGFTTWTVKRSTFIEGAFINGPGGIDLNLEPCGAAGHPCPDRALRIQLLGLPASGVPDECKVPIDSGVNSADVDFRFNVFTPSGEAGVETLTEGTSITGNRTTGRWVAGVVNFAISASAHGTLYFNYSHDTAWDGNITLSRQDGNTWTLESGSSVYFECTVTGKRSRSYSVGTFAVPFGLTVVKQ